MFYKRQKLNRMKIFKYLLYLILTLIIVGFTATKYFSEKMPVGNSGSQADALAEAVMAGLNKPAFDTIPYLQWEFFKAGQKYLWDKKNNMTLIEWDDNKVLMDLEAITAQSYSNGIKQTGASHDKLKAKAWSNWCNDSFWMIAPFKLFDKGTSRELVTLEDGSTGLKIIYNSGGVTPGDVYLWQLDRNNRPIAWKMWSSILPVQGLSATWSGWEEHHNVWLSTEHKMAGMTMQMKNVHTGNHWSDFGYKTNPFL